MSIETKVIDGKGRGNRVEITDENAIFTQDTGLPPKQQEAVGTVYRQYLRNSAGSLDMRVNGSSTIQEFYLEADPEFDIYIGSLSFVIADAGATLSEFGSISALSNGCELLYQNNVGDIQIADSLKSNFEFVRLCQGNPAFGTGAQSFRANNVEGSSEGFIPVLDITDVFGLTWGVKLRKGTSDRIIMRIKDDTSGVDAFNCIAYGFTRR